MSWQPTDEPWAEFYRNVNPGYASARTSWDRFKYATTVVNVTVQLWQARERALNHWHGRYGENPDGWPMSHPPVLLWLPESFTAACLRCSWGVTSGDGAHAATQARDHTIANGADPSRASRRPIRVWERGGPVDGPPPMRWA
jgi:hypothetical protein